MGRKGDRAKAGAEAKPGGGSPQVNKFEQVQVVVT